jgi:hypothetical protein
MALDTLIFDPSPCGFPEPRAPLLPAGLDGIAPRSVEPWAPAAHFRHFARGRYALHAACRLAGVGPGAALLAPAYHCRTMLDPALALAGEVILYPLAADLSPDLAAIETLARRSPFPAKALLAAHFFGFAQDFSALADWCAARGIALIEDASHALFCAQHRPAGIGTQGAFVTGSPYKFLPCPDGGLLFARDAAALDPLSPLAPPWRAELRGLADLGRRLAARRRARAACDPARVEAELAAAARAQQTAAAARELRSAAGCSPDYRAAEANLGPLRASRALCRRPDIARIAERRRDNYLRWLAATMNLPYCRPLFPELPAGCIPYMFPLLIDAPATRFGLLKRIGLPIWRWDSLAVSGCATAGDYRLRLLHLPCHPSLDGNPLAWMTAALRKVGAGGTAPSAPWT